MSWLRAGLAVLLLLMAYRALGQLVSLELIESGSIVALDIAERWDPDQPEIYFRRGLLRRDTSEYYDLDAACQDLAKAGELHPANWMYHLELGRCREAQGNLAAAESSFLQALAINPRSGPDHWALAHFYLRRNRTPDAIEHLTEAVLFDASLEPAALPLLSQAGVTPERLSGLWPQRRSSRMRLLKHFLELEPTSETRSAAWAEWRLLLADPKPPSPWEGTGFVRWLLRNDLESAPAEWVALARVNGLHDPAFAACSNLVWNGSFSADPTGTLLDWRVRDLAGVTTEWTPGGLKFDFDGTENLEGALLEQLVIVPPGASLRLKLRYEASGVTTDEPPRLRLTDRNGALLCGPVPLNDTQESEYSVRFQAPAEGLLRLQVYRAKSLRIDNRIAGTIRLGGVLLQLMKGTTDEALPDLSDR